MQADAAQNPDVIDLSPEERNEQSAKAMNLALGANIVLALLKTIFGIVGHSAALLADGINSTSDVVYNIVVALFVKRARKPADDEHPYGHTQLETIGAVVVGAFVVTTALTIFWNAVDSLFKLFSHETEGQPVSPITLYIALFTVALKIGLWIYTAKVGERTRNQAIMALGQDHRNDIISAAAVVVGILLSRMGYTWVDPLAGALVAFVILRTGLSILSESTDDLMDTVPGKKLRATIEGIVKNVGGVIAIDEVKAHRFGPYLVINIAIFVDGKITVDAGDAIADEVEKQLKAQMYYIRAVHVHFHSKTH